MVAAAAWLNALMGAGFLQVFGVYVVALQDAFGWQGPALAASFALQRASTAVASPLVGAWLRRFGARRVAAGGVVMFAVGTAFLGSVRTLGALFAVMPLLGVATTAMGPLTHASALVQRFARRRATAVAWTLTGVGLGGLLVPVVALVLTRHGMPTALLAVGIVALVTGLPAAAALGGVERQPGSSGAPAPPPQAANDASRPRGAGSPNGARRPNGALRSGTRRVPWPTGGGRAFWSLGIGHLLSAAVIGSLTVHLVPFLRLEHGLPVERASLLVGVLSVASMAAQVLGAPIADRLGHRRAAVTGAVLEAFGLAGLAFTSGASWAPAWIALVGVGWGLRSPQMFVLRADYFGRDAFATVMGWSMALGTVGLVLGPVTTARLLEGAAGPRGAFFTLAAFAAAAATAFLTAPSLRRKAADRAVG